MNGRMTIISSMATRPILLDLIATYERRMGCKVELRAMGGVDAARLVRAGENADIIVLAACVMEELETEEKVIAGSRRSFASSGIAMAVRSGAPRHNVGDEESVKRAISQARSICYSTGPSGDYLLKLVGRWGVLDSFTQRSFRVPPGIPVSTLIARGDADLGFQQLSELLHQPGVDIIGPLPAEIQLITVFSAGVGKGSSNPEAAKSFLTYLTSTEADAAKYRYGMGPA